RAGQVGQGRGDGVGEAPFGVLVAAAAGVGGVLGEGGHGERDAAGAPYHVCHHGGGRAGRDLAHQRGGRVGWHRGDAQPGRGRLAQGAFGVAGQAVRGAQGDGYPTVLGE